MKKILFLWIGLVIFTGTAAKADHDSPMGSVGLLLYESQHLNQEVRYSSLAYHVKDAVARFSQDVDYLAECVRHNVSNILDHLDEPGCPSRCYSYLDRTRQSFYSVDRYLYDTYYDYPHVYHAYTDTKRALNAIDSSPDPGPSSVMCIAMDVGYEEHSGGHRAYGRSSYEAERASLYECQRYHSSCRIYRCEYH